MDKREATRIAFRAVPETCPAVQAALDSLVDDLLNDYGDPEKCGHYARNHQIRRMVAHCFDAIEKQTSALRSAWIGEIESREEAKEIA